MPKKRKQYDDDDGRTVADMNVEGMPWYVRKRETPSKGDSPELEPAQKRAALWGALAAALVVAGIFIVAALLFILFCLFVWLK